MDSTRGVWLLDIDGVVNFMGDTSPWPDEASKASVWASSGAVGMAYTIQWSPALVAEIKRLCSTYSVELVLCSTWCGQAHQLMAELDLKPDREAFRNDGASFASVDTLKARAFEAACASQDGKVIWTDDASVPWWASHSTNSSGIHIVEPSELAGLTPNDIEGIESFLQEGVR